MTKTGVLDLLKENRDARGEANWRKWGEQDQPAPRHGETKKEKHLKTQKQKKKQQHYVLLCGSRHPTCLPPHTHRKGFPMSVLVWNMLRTSPAPRFSETAPSSSSSVSSRPCKESTSSCSSIRSTSPSSARRSSRVLTPRRGVQGTQRRGRSASPWTRSSPTSPGAKPPSSEGGIGNV